MIGYQAATAVSCAISCDNRDKASHQSNQKVKREPVFGGPRFCPDLS